MARTQSPQGQGLLELLIAIGIIMTSVVATTALVLATKATSDVSKGQILAANFAREGVEVVRAMRDANWLAIDSDILAADQWATGFSSGTDYTAIPSFDPTTATWSLLFGPNLITEADAIIRQSTGSGAYSQFVGIPPGPNGNFLILTNYRRLVTLNRICWDLSAANPETTEERIGSGQGCPTSPVKKDLVGIEVRSNVSWTEKGRTHALEVIDKLFNWKP